MPIGEVKPIKRKPPPLLKVAGRSMFDEHAFNIYLAGVVEDAGGEPGPIPKNAQPRLISVKEAAERMGCSERTLRNRVNEAYAQD